MEKEHRNFDLQHIHRSEGMCWPIFIFSPWESLSLPKFSLKIFEVARKGFSDQVLFLMFNQQCKSIKSSWFQRQNTMLYIIVIQLLTKDVKQLISLTWKWQLERLCMCVFTCMHITLCKNSKHRAAVVTWHFHHPRSYASNTIKNATYQ